MAPACAYRRTHSCIAARAPNGPEMSGCWPAPGRDWCGAVLSRAELRRRYPNASEAFLRANAAEEPGCTHASASTPKRIDVTSATKQLLMAGSEDDFLAFVTARAE